MIIRIKNYISILFLLIKVLPLPVHLLPARRLVFSADSSKLISATSQALIQVRSYCKESFKSYYILQILLRMQWTIS